MSAPAAWAPRPGAAPARRAVAATAALELRLLARNGEQLLLTLAIPLLVLVGLARTPLLSPDAGERLSLAVPAVLALAVVSTAFTGLGIATGFERRYGALRLLGVTPLTRGGLLAAKALAVLAVITGQALVLLVAGAALGWRPGGNPVAAVACVVAGTAAFGGLGLLLAGTLRAEATLAAANLAYLLVLAGGGLVVPADRLPDGVRPLVALLPSSALGDGLRAALVAGGGWPLGDLALVVGWAALAAFAVRRWFRWD